ncbi:hypothetical protein PTNB73_05369 [Pyrenophora teres f. teres]|nr:hypothetical protein PTNB85_04388 [Pyrenophora teres f. teres]KAE8867275.1 hypothetical protein PTNB73_05369 [Pyrenophora teres f. teres]
MSSADDSSAPKYVLWPYTPTIAAGAIAASIMFILFFTHTFLLFKNKAWFCIPLVIGALCEAIGYSARAAAHNNTDAKTPYIIQSTLILLAPILFAASIYMILGRLMRRTESTKYSLVRVGWVTKVFVGGDVLCFLIQAGGAALLISASTPSAFSRGENVILSGLILQILIFGFFVVVAGVWHHRLTRQPTAAAVQLPWDRLIKVLYVSSVCITLRNVGRVVEYAMGKEGYLLKHEWPVYLYDCALMVGVLGAGVWWYGRGLEERKERKGDVEMRG